MVAVVVLASSLSGVDVAADDPVSSNVRYSREIVRILRRRCTPCHRADGIAEPFETYRQVREWGRAIREEVVEQRMPPPIAAPGFGVVASPFAMTQRETQTLLSWLDGGMPRGNDRDLPALEPVHTHSDAVDVRVPLPRQEIPAGTSAVIRRVTLTLEAAPKLARRVEVRSRRPQAFKGAMVFGAGDRWIGGGIAGQIPVEPPPAVAAAIAPRETVTVMLFYRSGEQPASDDPELIITPVEAGNPAVGFTIDTRTPRQSIERPLSLWSMQVVPGEQVRTVEVRMRQADGATRVLAWLPRVSADWPIVLGLEEPVPLPQGSMLTVVAKDATGSPAPARVSFSATAASRP